MMLSFGIDLSFIDTGLAVIDNEGYYDVESYTTTKKTDDEPRMMEIADRVIDFIIENGFVKDRDKVCMEALAFAAKGQAVHRLAGLHYYVRIRLFQKEIPFEVVMPTSLKKFVLGKHNKKGTKKEHMLLHCFKRWNAEFNNNNQCDAYCLAQFARKGDDSGK